MHLRAGPLSHGQGDLFDDVILWRGKEFRLWLLTADIYELVPPTSGPRVVIYFENYNLEFRRIPDVMDYGSGINRVSTSLPIDDKSFDHSCADVFDPGLGTGSKERIACTLARLLGPTFDCLHRPFHNFRHLRV